MRSRRAVQESLIGKLPPGFALSKRGGIIDALYKAFAQALAETEAATVAALEEISPRRADRLLADFERVLGADPCGRDQGAKTLDDRQALAWQRWIATGGQSIPYFLALAKALGFEVKIEDFWPSVAGAMQAGTPLIPEGEQFVWVVHMRVKNAWHFRAGRNTAGEPLGGWDEGSLECIFRRLKPAHSHVVFYYDNEDLSNG